MRHSRIQEQPSTTSFYHLAEVTELSAARPLACTGTACFAARSREPGTWASAQSQEATIRCLGRCYEAPATTASAGKPAIEAHCAEPVVLGRIIGGSGPSFESYVAYGGYSALADTLSREPSEIVGEIEASGLRGRGGAGFPAATKWAAVAGAPNGPKYVVANADEGDPGAYIDRFLIELDPNRLIESMAAAAWAVGASKGFVYLRNEYPAAEKTLRTAIKDAGSSGMLGQNVLGTPFSFEIEVVIGHGSYVCGEETALIRSIEGRRPEPWARPPYPTECGLFGRPTLVQNVETLASVPWILSRGGAAFARMGLGRSTGTKAVSLNSLFARPGLYEVEMGTPLSVIVDEIGGGVANGELKALMVGGPLAGLLPPSALGTPLAFEEMREAGGSVGHGGIVAFDESTSIAQLVAHVFEFASDESCGKCTPCRAGSARIHHALRDRGSAAASRDEWDAIVAALEATSLCGHGGGLADFARSIERHFPEELASCLA